jgi:hypothetical protein
MPKDKELREGRPFRSTAALSDVSDLLVEDKCADVAMTWRERGIELLVKLTGKFSENMFPRYRDGDSIELFINTRNLIGSSSVHKFCHHLIFLPDGSGVEMTRLRADEERPLAGNLEAEVLQEGRSTLVSIRLSDEMLYGFEPSLFAEIGFAYRINRHQGEPQCFPLSSRDIVLESNPNLWGTITLENA